MSSILRGAERVSEPSAFIRGLRKAELHLHLEGTVDPPTLAELSRRHPTPLPVLNNRYKDVSDSGRVLSINDAHALYDYKNFVGFLMAFKAVTERMRDPEDYELVTYRMIEKLAREGVVYAEVYVSVGVIFWRGQEFDPLF
jgi:adenosine deaminase/aminodeoxyfutalosine deaminase